jgi:pteridine reductase
VAEFPESMQDKERELLIARIPLGHAGTPKDVAQAVAYLASAPYVTGQILSVDGGRGVNP